jgi:hypothetical protein
MFFLAATSTASMARCGNCSASNPRLSLRRMDCFAEPVIGRRFAPTRRLAMTDRTECRRPKRRNRRAGQCSVTRRIVAGSVGYGCASTHLRSCDAARMIEMRRSDLPVGLRRDLAVQPPSQKYFAFPVGQISSRNSVVPARRGAYHDRRICWARDAVDAAASARKRDRRADDIRERFSMQADERR